MTDKSVNVYYNNEKIKVKSFESYMKMYIQDKQKYAYEQIHQRWEIGITMSNTDKFEQVSFVQWCIYLNLVNT